MDKTVVLRCWNGRFIAIRPTFHFQIGSDYDKWIKYQEKGFSATAVSVSKPPKVACFTSPFGTFLIWSHGEIEFIDSTNSPRIMKWLTKKRYHMTHLTV